MLQIARRMGWTYVSIVYSAGTYGDGAVGDIQYMLRTTAANYGICLAVLARIPSNAVDADYNYIVDELAADVNARVVLAYLSTTNTDGLFAAVKRRVGLGWFLFVGSDSMSYGLISSFTDVVEGCIFVDLPVGIIPGFEKYVQSLTYNGTGESTVQQVERNYTTFATLIFHSLL
jgi:Receptor family ligand binding region